MEEAELTLQSLFDLFDSRLRPQISRVVTTTALAARLTAKTLHFSKDAIADQIADKIAAELRNVELIDVLAAAWNKEREIAEYMENGHKSSGKTDFVTLLEHKVESTWPFVVKITVQPLSYKIHLDLKTQLTLHSGTLKIEDGEITTLISGRISGKITLSVESAEIWKQECKPIDLLPLRLKKRIVVEQAQVQKAAG